MDGQEARRLAALHALGALDTPAEAAFDRVTALAAELFDTPMALVSLVDAERQWFKSHHGLEAQSTPREWAFCAHAIDLEQNAVMVVEDATGDPRFADNPLVTGHPDIRFYAGAVLTTRGGENIGTLCVIDTKPRARPSDVDLARLDLLARIVVDEFELAHTTRLAREERRLLELAEAVSGVGHWRYQLADGTVTWSDEVYRIHGVDRDSFRPGYDDAVSFYHPDDQGTVDEAMARSIDTKTGFEFQLRLIRRDGDRREVVCKAVCELDDLGEVRAVFGVFQDITDRQAARQALEQSEFRHRLIAESATDIISRMGLDGRVTYFSPSVTAVTGYAVAEVTGASMIPLLHPDDIEPTLRAYRDLIAGKPRGAALAYRIRHKQGHWVWLEGSPAVVRDATGAVSEIIDVRRDVTARVLLEAELREARTAAEAAAAVKADFLANMSHELRTPLTSIIGFTGLVTAQTELSELSRNYIERVGNASRALLSTVNDILDFSKLEAGQVSIHPAPVSIGKLASATLELFTPQAGAKDLSLILDGDARCDDLVLSVDPDRMRQILLNFVSNAVKFTAAGGVTLRMHYHPPRGVLRVEVADTGDGISAEQQARLFKRFSQIDGSLTRTQSGTGLGLAICKGLTEAMGGQIGMTSQVGEGSTFWFEIPAQPASLPDAAASGTASAQVSFAGVRVLVADDNAANRELARLYLAAIGAEVSEAVDGLEAVSLAEEHPFDVILMDVQMPRLDGLSALRRIRSGYGFNDATPILAFTADADADAQARMVRQGFDDVVSKPVEPAVLLAAVARATDFVGQQRKAPDAA